MSKTAKPQETRPSSNSVEPKKSGELSETALDRIAGGKHPAKVTVPDIK
jgi:hypothetical protein